MTNEIGILLSIINYFKITVIRLIFRGGTGRQNILAKLILKMIYLIKKNKTIKKRK
jgi:hypothetical protein